MNWPRRYADTGSTACSGLCLTFVFDAYSQAGVNLRSQVSVDIGSNTSSCAPTDPKPMPRRSADGTS